MPRITPAPMEEGIEVPSISMTSGVSIKGSPFEYLLTDLAWDAEEPVVKEFLALVEKHFKQ